MHGETLRHTQTPPPRLAPFLLALVALVALAPAAEAAEHRLGVGAQFWKTVDDLADDGFGDIEDDGFSWVVGYQYRPSGLLSFELDLEWAGDGFGGSTESAYSPIAFILVGHGFYAGVGAGVTVSDGFEDDDVSDPFWIGRVGWDVALLPGLSVDVNANYRAGAFDELEGTSTDAITLGAVLRFSL